MSSTISGIHLPDFEGASAVDDVVLISDIRIGAPANLPPLGSTVTFFFTQDAVGGHAITSWHHAFGDMSWFTPLQGAKKTSVVSFRSNGDGTLSNYASVTSAQSTVSTSSSSVGGTLVPDFGASQSVDAHLDSNLTVSTPVNAPTAGQKVQFTLRQDATGGRQLSSWSASFKGVAGFMPRQGPSQASSVTFVYNGDGTYSAAAFDGINLQTPLNPIDWGAVGDSVTDDTAAVAACLAFAKAQTPPSPVVLTAKHLVTKPAVIDVSNFKLSGAGRNTSGLVHNSTYCGPDILVVPQWAQMPTRAALATGSGVAMQLDGTNHYFLNFADAPTLSLNGLSQFAIEFFFHLDSSPASTSNLLSCQGNSSLGNNKTFQLYVNPASAYGGPAGQAAITAQLNVGGVLKEIDPGFSAVYFSTGATHHLAFTYDGATVRLFVDGAIQGTIAATGTITSTPSEDFTVGASIEDWPEQTADASMPVGAIDSIRVSNTARHTSAFTAPTAKHAWDGNTLLLHNFDNEQRYFSVASVLAGSQVPLWMPLRRGDNGGSLIGDVTLENFGTQSIYQLRGGIQVYACSQFRAEHLYIGAACGLRLDNNSFTSYLSDLEIWGNGGTGMGARFGIVLGTATGAGECDRIRMVGYKYGLVATDGGGWDFGPLYFAPSTDSLYSMIILSSDATMDGVDAACVIRSISVDDEAASASYVAGLLVQNIDTLTVLGGNFDVSTVGHSSAAIAVDGGRDINCHGTAFAGNVSATPFFSFINPPAGSVNLKACQRYRTVSPWADASHTKYVNEDGAQRVAVADADYTANARDRVIAYATLTAARAVTIPAASAVPSGQPVIVKDEAGAAGAHTLTIAPASGTIDGAASKTITSNYGVLRLYGNGTNWFTE